MEHCSCVPAASFHYAQARLLRENRSLDGLVVGWKYGSHGDEAKLTSALPENSRGLRLAPTTADNRLWTTGRRCVAR